MTNRELANELRDLRDLLIIAGFDESNAHRYTQIARQIDKMGQPVEEVRAEGTLDEIPGVGRHAVQYIKEYLDTGTCSKRKECEGVMPSSLLGLVRIPGLGPKTARRLFLEFQIADLADLEVAIKANRFRYADGIGLTTVDNWKKYLDARQ